MACAFAHGPEEGCVAPTTRGTWRRWLHKDKRTVAVCCPGCGGPFCLANHTIATDGSVSPSVVCPQTPGGQPCGFHEFIRLEGWS